MSDPRFFTASRSVSVGEIAALTKARLVSEPDAAIRVDHVAALGEGTPASLVFATRRKNLEAVEKVIAAAILCPEDVVPAVPQGIAILVSANPQRDFAAVGRLIYPAAARPPAFSSEKGIAPSAIVDPTARLEENVVIEAGAFIGADVEIGSGSVVAPNAVIGPNCRIGRDCFIGPRACLQHALVGDRVIIHPGTSIGQDGFGYVPGPHGAEKMPQLGRVIIQNDVEIGANSAIDRGALGDTVIGEGTKIDNLVQIGHNVRIGRGCMIAGNCGLAGSVTLGDFVMLGGKVGIADHVRIGSFAQLTGGAGVMSDIPERAIWGGQPAKPIKDAWREQVALRELVKTGRGKAADR